MRIYFPILTKIEFCFNMMNNNGNDTFKLDKKNFTEAIFSIMMGMTAMAGNFLILVLILKYKTLRRNHCICLLGLLAICDFFVGRLFFQKVVLPKNLDHNFKK